MKITGETKLIGIFGFPVAHSLSPQMQNAAFEAMGVNICYVPLEVKPQDLNKALLGIRAMHFLGANVTIPHKVQVASLVDRLDASAAMTGAVNTVVNESGTLIGHNTDGVGFINAIKEVATINFQDESALLLGAGGAARAIAAALAEQGIKKLALVNRTRHRAQEIDALISANFTGVKTIVLTPEDIEDSLIESCKIVINATSIGLEGDLKMPSVRVDRLTKDHVVCDIVYTQTQETPFLVAARGKGATTLGGLGMLLHQGAAAIRLWTGIEAPIDIMRGAIEP